MQEGIED